MKTIAVTRRFGALVPALFSAFLILAPFETTGAQETGDNAGSPTPDAAGRGAPEQPADSSTAPEPSGRSLKENLEETIREGERVLRELPRRRQRILRSRIANLERQEKRKERELEDVQETLASLRADFYRRLAALDQKRAELPGEVVETRRKRLRDDFDLHVEAFEEERVALEEDIASIRRTVEKLRAQSLASRVPAVPARLEPPSPPGASEKALRIPDLIDPFEVESVVPLLRGRAHASSAWLWSFRAEAAFHQSDNEAAKKYWSAAFEESVLPDELRRGLATNLALLAYRRGEFAVAYRFYSERLGGRKPEELSEREAYTMAVLSYLNGDLEGAKRHLQQSGDEDRERMEEVLGTLGKA